MDEEFNGTEEPNLTNKILESILERLDKLETKSVDTGVVQASKSESSASVNEQTTSSSNDCATGNASASNTPTTTNSADSGTTDAIDLQREYWAIKDSLSKVQLSPSHKLNEVALGINKKDKPVQKVLQKTSRCIETGLKLCQLALTDTELNQESDAYKYIEQIFIVLQAGIQQNQQEFQSLLVQGQFSEDTARVFRILQQNNNCFPQTAVNQLELAAKISTMNVSQTQSNNNNYRGRSRESFHGRGGGSFRGRSSYRFQGNNRSSPDVYRQFTNNSMPPFGRNNNTSDDV